VRSRLDDATFKGSIEACRVAASLNARHYVPGHGPTGGVEIVKAYQAHQPGVPGNRTDQLLMTSHKIALILVANLKSRDPRFFRAVVAL